ncbi:MAG: hypothetical protein RLZZ71_1953 [Bacteroidota bacterium]|jgi:hypothetical protein
MSFRRMPFGRMFFERMSATSLSFFKIVHDIREAFLEEIRPTGI